MKGEIGPLIDSTVPEKIVMLGTYVPLLSTSEEVAPIASHAL